MDGHGGFSKTYRLKNCLYTMGFFLLAVAPNGTFFGQYRKQPHTRTFYMPTWEEPEMLDLRAAVFSGVPEKQAKDLFALYGGVPRQVLELVDDGAGQLGLLNDAIAFASNNLSDILCAGALSGSALSDKILRILVPFHNGAYDFSGCDIAFRSPRVAEQILFRGQAAATAFALFYVSHLPVSAAVMAGELFEPAALRCLWLGGSFRVRPGPEPAASTPWEQWAPSHFATAHSTAVECTLALAPALPEQIVHFTGNKASELSFVTLGQYGVPSSRNFPVADCVLLIDENLTIFIQATVSSTHPFNESAFTDMLLSLPSSASRNVAFLFAVPESSANFTSFAKFGVTEERVKRVAAACTAANTHKGFTGKDRFYVRPGILALPYRLRLSA